MDATTVKEIGNWLLLLVGGPTGAVAIVKTAPRLARVLSPWTWGPVLAHFRGVHQMIEALPRIEGQVTKIRQRVEAELGPNGGGSMKDQVTVIAARQAAIFDGMSRPAFQADAEGRFVSVNRAFETMTGYPSRDLLGMGWVNLIHQSEVEDFMLAWKHTMEDGRILRRATVIVTSSDVELAVCVDAIPVKAGKRVLEWQGTFEQPEAA